MSSILLDTDYVIDYLRGKESVRDLIFDLLSKGKAYLSILSVYEIYAGMHPNEEVVTDNFIKACYIEPVTLTIAKNAGLFRYKYQKKGITLSVVDCLIAETARANNHIIATHNKKHYPESSLL